MPTLSIAMNIGALFGLAMPQPTEGAKMPMVGFEALLMGLQGVDSESQGENLLLSTIGASFEDRTTLPFSPEGETPVPATPEPVAHWVQWVPAVASGMNAFVRLDAPTHEADLAAEKPICKSGIDLSLVETVPTAFRPADLGMVIQRIVGRDPAPPGVPSTLADPPKAPPGIVQPIFTGEELSNLEPNAQSNQTDLPGIQIEAGIPKAAQGAARTEVEAFNRLIQQPELGVKLIRIVATNEVAASSTDPLQPQTVEAFVELRRATPKAGSVPVLPISEVAAAPSVHGISSPKVESGEPTSTLPADEAIAPVSEAVSIAKPTHVDPLSKSSRPEPAQVNGAVHELGRQIRTNSPRSTVSPDRTEVPNAASHATAEPPRRGFSAQTAPEATETLAHQTTASGQDAQETQADGMPALLRPVASVEHPNGGRKAGRSSNEPDPRFDSAAPRPEVSPAPKAPHITAKSTEAEHFEVQPKPTGKALEVPETEVDLPAMITTAKVEAPAEIDCAPTLFDAKPALPEASLKASEQPQPKLKVARNEPNSSEPKAIARLDKPLPGQPLPAESPASSQTPVKAPAHQAAEPLVMEAMKDESVESAEVLPLVETSAKETTLPTAPHATVATAPAIRASERAETTPVHGPELRPEVRDSVLRQVADRIEMTSLLRSREAVTIHLDPLDLGQIKVVLSHTDGRMDAQIYAQDERVQQVLASSHQDLSRTLEARGLRLDAFRVDSFASTTSTASDQGHRAPTDHAPARHFAFREPASPAMPCPTVRVKTSALDLAI